MAQDAFCFRRFHRFHLINFTGWIYSGNGKLLQGDIYRGGADGRAAWREIKSDCLGKSEPSTRAIGTTALRARPAGTPSFRRVVVLHTSRETKNTKNIRIETLADLRRLPRTRVRLFSSRVRFNPFDGLRSATGDGITALAHPRKYFPNSDKAPRCIIRCVRPRAANKFLSNTTGILLSSFRRAVIQLLRELFILSLTRNAKN